MKKAIILLIVCFGLAHLQADAQSRMKFTRAVNTQKIYNPAYNRPGNDISLFTSYRNQWVGMDGAPQSTLVNVQMPFLRHGIAIGATYINEQWAFFGQNTFYASFAYTIPLNNSQLSFGMSGGVNTFAPQQEKIVSYSETFSGDRFALPNLGAGINYQWRTLTLGLSAPELLSTSYVTGNTVELTTASGLASTPVFIYAGYRHTLTPEIIVEPVMLIQRFNKYGTQLHLATNVYLHKKIIGGIGWRSSEAVTFTLGYRSKSAWEVIYSVDVITTQLSGMQKGTHEICLQFDFPKKNSPIHVIDNI